MTDSNTMHYSLASRRNFASFRSCDFYYRAMHFSAKRGIAIACRLSVRTIRYDTIEEINVDSKAEYTA